MLVSRLKSCFPLGSGAEAGERELHPPDSWSRVWSRLWINSSSQLKIEPAEKNLKI